MGKNEGIVEPNKGFTVGVGTVRIRSRSRTVITVDEFIERGEKLIEKTERLSELFRGLSDAIVRVAKRLEQGEDFN